jgi:hypothetical protein
MPLIESKTPNALSNQRITIITTTTFRMLLIFPSMGIYEFISQRTTPTTTSTSKIVSKGIKKILD